MHSVRKHYELLGLLLILVVLNIILIRLEFKNNEKVLTFAVLNVGQGDALFIESPSGTQMLIDGGPPRRILSELARIMPPFDRKLDAILITNPDQDHVGGFHDIISTYQVGQVFEPGTFNDSRTYQNLKTEIKNKKIPETLAKSGMRLDLGAGVVIDILFPDRDVTTWDTNEGSIVAKLTYGETSIMLTGDSVAKTESIILENFSKEALDIDILKVGHHGSRTSTSKAFINATTPEYAIISAGKDNKYGHPHSDALEDLAAAGAKILRTDVDGTVVVKSDGKYVNIEK